tara:strand:- start:315 stop:911 length:597 start_codon:yes stop_codon:yes gene_type:complete
MKELNQKLATIQTQFKSKKSRYNSFGKYYFRSAEDILEATKPFLLDLGVSVTLTEQVIPGYNVPIIQSTAIISDGENQITATAVVGVDLLQKGMQMPQKYGAASSYAKKYALGNLFLIDDTQDADGSNEHDKGVVNKLKERAKSNITAEQMNKAKVYIMAGGKVETIKAKYKITPTFEQELLKIIETNEQTTDTEKAS